MQLLRLPCAFETVSGLRDLPKATGKEWKECKKPFYTVSANLNKGGKSGIHECNYEKKSGRLLKEPVECRKIAAIDACGLTSIEKTKEIR